MKTIDKKENFINRLEYFLMEFMKSIEDDGVNLANQWIKNEVDHLNEYVDFKGTKYEYDFILVKEILEDAVTRSELEKDTPIEELARILVYGLYGILLCWCITNGAYKLEDETKMFCDGTMKEIFKKYLKEEFKMNCVKLNNGVEMPMIGIGTFCIKPEDAEVTVREGLKMGYRLIDTANAYVNEKAVGRGIKASGVAREEVFVSSKIWATEYLNPRAVDNTLERLGIDYIDLLFIHQPTENYMEGYRMIQKAYKEGKVKAIGISNCEGEYLENILAFL